MAINSCLENPPMTRFATLLAFIFCLTSLNSVLADNEITHEDKCRVWKTYVDRRVARYREEIEVMSTKQASLEERLARPESLKNERERSMYQEKAASAQEKIRLNQLKIDRFQQRRNCAYAAGLSPIKYRYCKWVLEASRQGKSTGAKLMAFVSEMGNATKEELYQLREWLHDLGE